jgi:hypothetical protein
MVRPARIGEISEVVYDKERWSILRKLRQEAIKLMTPFLGLGLSPIVHGSVARGDVDKNSDVDVFIPATVPSYRVELALRGAGFGFWKREIVMATPWQLPKAHVYVDENRSVTFPLVKPKPLELEFYNFGGATDFDKAEMGARVPGVDKRLMLIEPTPQGHVESQVMGKEAEVAKLVGVSLDIVRERVQVLMRRAEVGHTGIFIQRVLAPSESFEMVLRSLLNENSEMQIGLKGRLP